MTSILVSFVNLYIEETGVAPNKALGKRLEIARLAIGYNQTQLAEKLNVSQKTVSRWESTGNFPSFMIGPIARITKQESEFFIL